MKTPETNQGPNPKRGRNVGKTWVETWAKWVRVWNFWWLRVVFGFMLAPEPDARKHFMETRNTPFQMCFY